jgi:hypothetical protein
VSGRSDSDEGSLAEDLPHAVQVGLAPAFIGEGSGDLVCPCGQSVLIRGYLPRNFLAISIKCFRCGAVSVTPGLPDGDVLPHDAVAVPRRAVAMVASTTIPRAAVFASEEAIQHDYAATRPRSAPAEPMTLDASVLAATAADFDRLSGGALAAHIAAAERSVSLDATEYPFALAQLRLRGLVDRPGWSWLYQNDDAMAAMHIAAFQDFLHCWGQYPRLDRLAPALAAPGRFLRIMTGFATAKLLYDAGNRVGLSLPDAVPHFSAGSDEALSLAMLAPDALQWRRRERWNAQVIRSAVTEALASVQGQVNGRRPGIVVLSVSILLPGFEQALVDGIGAVLHSVGRKHRGVAAVVFVMPKVAPVKRLDQVGFGYDFCPVTNPYYSGENPIRLGAQQDFVPTQGR